MTSGGIVASPVLINQGGIISQVLHVPGQALPAGHVILTLPPPQKPKSNAGDEDEEEEPVDRSRSPSPLLPTFAGPVVRYLNAMFYAALAYSCSCGLVFVLARPATLNYGLGLS